MKQALINSIKNIRGWSSNKKIIVFSVDDYGNVRVDSADARQRMNVAGLKILSRFDAFDSLENKEDLLMLFETLSSVKDSRGNHAIFTPFAVPCNINFEQLAANNYQQYSYELLPETLAKLKGYEDVWDLWKEGISKGLLVPQFHGREHLNLKVFEEKLKQKDHELLTALQNRSYTSLSNSGYKTIAYTAAFDFWNSNENERFANIITDGLNAFEKVFGYRAVQFNAPGASENAVIHPMLKKSGIKYIDVPYIKKEHQGNGKFLKSFNYTGKQNWLGQIYQVRNVVFEPTHDRGIDWVNYSLAQIESAFFWKRPAIISSHRVNFCGHINPDNRQRSINDLAKLLRKIIVRWPDVEFMSANQLGDLIQHDSKKIATN